MPRPRCCRRITAAPAATIFKPVGIPARDLDEIVMTLDEFEAIRLADLEGLYQEECAAEMGVSRQTLGRILQEAHRKMATVISLGLALRIEGGTVEWGGRARPRGRDAGRGRCGREARCSPSPKGRGPRTRKEQER